MDLSAIVSRARGMGASDIHLSVGEQVFFRIDGFLQRTPLELSDSETEAVITSMLSDKQLSALEQGQDVDFAFRSLDGARQRVNVFRQQGHLAATIRLLESCIPSLEQLQLPATLRQLADKPRGLVLVTGPTGSGKSTTLAAMVDYVNTTSSRHIITIEDPVEYRHASKMSLVHQRELGQDTRSFSDALRSSLREDPDVILVGEMRDYETVCAALTAAETGHLVLSTLHTIGAAQSIDRIIDACPLSAQSQTRTQLASVLQGVVTQCLVPLAQGEGRCAATEILLCTDAVLNMIRDNRCHQLASAMQSAGALGMHTLNSDLAAKARKGLISRQSAVDWCTDKREMEDLLGQSR